MAKNTIKDKTVSRRERLNASYAGNPRFKLFFTDGTSALTQTDASVNYDFENEENIGVPLRVEFTPNGRVVGITRISGR